MQQSDSQCIGAFFEMETGGNAPSWIVGDTFLVRHHHLSSCCQLLNISPIRKTFTRFSDSIPHPLGSRLCHPLLQPRMTRTASSPRQRSVLSSPFLRQMQGQTASLVQHYLLNRSACSPQSLRLQSFSVLAFYSFVVS
jgi:hypothetical protein